MRRVPNSDMKGMALPRRSVAVATEDAEDRLRRSKERWTVVLIVACVLSAFDGLTGFALTTASWLFAGGVRGLGTLGTILTVLFFPLLILVGHSLDRIRDADMALRFERLKKRLEHGFKEDQAPDE